MKLNEQIKRISKLAAQLSREDAGQYRSLDEIVADAAVLIRAGDAARAAIEKGRTPAAHFSRAGRVAALYLARTVERGDTEGMVLGVRFSSGRYSDGADHIFCVA